MSNNTGDGQEAGNQVPAWAVEMLKQMQRMEQRHKAINEQLEMLQETMAAATTGQRTPTTSTSTLDAGERMSSLHAAPLIGTLKEEKRTTRPRQVLPTPPEFSGKPEDYRVWRMEMAGKLATDGEAIGIAHDQCAYIFTRLGSVAKKMMVAYVEADAHQGEPQNFIDYLDSIYINPDEAFVAATRLKNIRQGPNEPAADFLPRFETLLLGNILVEGSDQIAINYLRNALNRQTMMSLVANPSKTYKDFKARVLCVGSWLEEPTRET